MEGPAEIHEQEVGHKVFGRPRDYDTGSDNIVRVHASMLRKRLEQYFAEDGAAEPVIVEIPRGNYAPVFHERAVELALGSADGLVIFRSMVERAFPALPPSASRLERRRIL